MTDRAVPAPRTKAPRGRVKAGDTCKAKGWRAGPMLESDEWAEPRKLMRYDWSGAAVYYGKSPREQWLRTFPADVREAACLMCGRSYSAGHHGSTMCGNGGGYCDYGGGRGR